MYQWLVFVHLIGLVLFVAMHGVAMFMAFRLRTERVRVVIRPSGTEPKLKCYLQVVAPVPDGANLTELRASAAIQMSSLTAEIAAVVGLPGS